MDKEWSAKNSEIQKLLSKKATFSEGIEKLIAFRKEMMKKISQIVINYPKEAFYQQPYLNADGYHSKTLAYSMWHIFRIEDITMHELVRKDQQVFFRDDYQKRIGSDIITTGNELQGKQIAEYSEKLNVRELYRYCTDVMEVSNEILMELEYDDLKRRFTEEDRARLVSKNCVSTDEKAFWLVDYWCGKDVRGLIFMPFSRHWIMHIEAMRRIKNKLCKDAKKGIDPIAYCGLSCSHCFLSENCGSCRTIYNTCSFATIYEDKKCPNMVCCKEKGLDGCYECEELENCTKGFYGPNSDGAAAAKAEAMFIRKYGKKEYLKAQDRMHLKYDFKKAQEILGQDRNEGFRILEETYKGK